MPDADSTAAPAAAPAAPAEGEGDKSAAPEAEDYTLEAPKELPEGVVIDPVRLGKLNEFAKTHKLPKEAAQALLALGVENAQAQQEALAATAAQWKDEVLKDPVLGKPEAVAAVRKVVAEYGDDALTDLLNTTGMANHPTVVRFVHKVSQALSEDAFIPDKSRGTTAIPRDAAAVLYGTPTH